MEHELTVKDIETMWKVFSKSLRQAIRDFAPLVEKQNRQNVNEPVCFNRETRKLACKQKKLYYNKYKRSKDTYSKQLVASHRRLAKNTFKQSKKQYIETRVCKPLQEGNRRPFYKHLKGTTGSRNQMRLVKQNRQLTPHPKKCADMLNKHFHKQFTTDQQLLIQNCSKTYTEVPSVFVSEIGKMIQDPKSGKAP